MKLFLAAVLLAFLAAPFCSSADFRLVLLGTGNPNPDPDHSGPAAAVIAGGHPYIVDAGPGVVRRAVQAHIAATQLTRAFITHLHSDHTIGLPDLILTPAVMGRASPLELYGPPGLNSMVTHLLEAYREDIDIRLHGGEPSLPAAYVVHAHDVQPGEIYHDDAVSVTAFSVPHGAWKYAYGYRFDSGGKSIVFSGDTGPTDQVAKACNGCGILVYEVYSAAGLEKRTADWQRYHGAFHTSAIELGKIAAAARPQKLVLTHILLMGQTPDELVSEVRQNFKGEVILGEDLKTIDVGTNEHR